MSKKTTRIICLILAGLMVLGIITGALMYIFG